MNKISTPLGIAIIIVIAFILVGGVLAYQYWWLPKQETPPQESLSIKVLSPNGGEVLEVGKTYEIKWNSSYPSVEKVTIALQDTRYSFDSESPLGEAPVAVSVPNSGNYNWEIPTSLTDMLGRTMALGAGNIYKITVYLDRRGGECKAQRCDISDASFSIVAAETLFVTVLSPNGGEEFKVGDTIPIRWSYANGVWVDGYIYRTSGGPIYQFCEFGSCVDIQRDPFGGSALAGQVAISLSLKDFIVANDYRIHLDLSSEGDRKVAEDDSDAPFTIK